MCLKHIIIISIFLYVWLSIFTNNKEHYDSKIINSNENECGIMCTKAYGCLAFSQDNKNTCYLSKTRLLGSPTTSVFKNDYDINFTKCNKVQQLDDPVSATPMDLKRNATYICNINNKDEIRIYDNKKTVINKLDDLYNIYLNKYEMGDIDWGIELDKNKYPKLYTNSSSIIPKINIMKEHDDEFMGQYLFPHRCVFNTSQKDCLNQCKNNEKCLGTEWNPLFLKKKDGKTDLYNGVCCPKIKINEIIERRPQHKYGKFYLKEEYKNGDNHFFSY